MQPRRSSIGITQQQSLTNSSPFNTAKTQLKPQTQDNISTGSSSGRSVNSSPLNYHGRTTTPASPSPSNQRRTIHIVPRVEIRQKKEKLDSAFQSIGAQILFSKSHHDESLNSTLSSTIEITRRLQQSLEFRQDTDQVKQSDMLDLDSQSGKAACQKYLKQLTELFNDVGCKLTNRNYRQHYSASYKKMMIEPYLCDVLDSAQEAFPFMWVNGEKYVFSEHVIQKGITLFQKFKQICSFLPTVRSQSQVDDLKQILLSFDVQWCLYEQAYIGELMVIERDARRFIFDLVDNLTSKTLFINAVGQLNSVANIQGQGRQDFDPQLLELANQLQIDSIQVTTLQEKVKTAFTKLFNYAKKLNVDEVDPQMRNNRVLSDMLKEFEEAWILGTEHLLNAKHRNHLVQFSALIQRICQKYEQFKQMVESCDSQIFISIPALAILHNLEQIVSRFAPSLQIKEIVTEVNQSCKLPVIELDVLELANCGLKVAQKVKSAGVQLSRENSEQWNQFVNVCLQ